MKEDIGIYGIMCIVNHVVHGIYIGQSIHVTRRWDSHQQQLKRNAHPNPLIQQLFNLYGEKAFKFIRLETCSKEELNSCELKWYEKMMSIYPLYNLRPLAPTYPISIPESSASPVQEELKGLDSIALEILSLYNTGNMPSYRSIARRHKVSKTVITHRVKLLKQRNLIK